MEYPCGQCAKTFSSSSARKYHRESVHQGMRYSCQLCDKIFMHKKSFQIHMKTHNGRLDYKCTHCLKYFVADEILKKHMRCHLEKRHECPLCHKMFNAKSQCDIHITQVHTEERPHRCEACGKCFKSQDVLKQHNGIHTNQIHKPYKCSICSYSSKRKNHLKRHEITHREVPMSSCPKCPKNYRNFSSLKRHLKVHESQNIQPTFHCIFCGRGYFSYQGYCIHLIVHVGEKPFNCDLCNKDFITSGDMISHIKRRHTREKPFACGTCGRQFITRQDLQRHSRIHLPADQPKPYSCVFCENNFNLESSLLDHIKSHIKEKPYSFQVCGEEVTKHSSMRRHNKYAHTKKKKLFE